MSGRKGIGRPLSYRQYNVTTWLIAVNVLMFLVVFGARADLRGFWLVPQLLAEKTAIWQLLTYQFVHASMMHLVFNMLMLFLFGSRVESEIGSSEFLALYLVTGAMAGAFSTLIALASNTNVYIVGASGAVYGVMLAYAVLNPNQIVMFWMIPMRSTTMVLLLGGLALVFQVAGQRTHVAHLTHLGGLVAGYLYVWLRLGVNPIDSFRR